jgi:hypothetical protein
MKQLDWQLVYFVGASIVQELWLYVSLPQIQYWKLTNDDKK